MSRIRTRRKMKVYGEPTETSVVSWDAAENRFVWAEPVASGGVSEEAVESVIDESDIVKERRLRNILSGKMVVVWGHSFTFSDSHNTPGRRWTDRMKDRLNLGWMLELGQGGSTAQDIANYMNGSAYAPRHYQGWAALYLIQTGALELLYNEDALSYRSSTPMADLGPRQKSSIRENLNAICAILMSVTTGRDEISAATGWTMSGQWTQASNPGSSGNQHHWSNTPGSYVEKVLNPGTYYVHLVSGRGDPALPFGRYQIEVDGTVVHPDFNADVSWDPANDGHQKLQMGRIARKVVIPEGTAQQRTLRIRKSDPTQGLFVAVDYVSPEVPVPPLALFVREWWDGDDHASPVAVASYQQIFHEVLDQYPFDWIDVSQDWDFDIHVGNDNVHANDEGQWLFADNFIRAIAEKVTGFDDRIHMGELNTSAVEAGAPFMYSKGNSFTFDAVDRDWRINTTAAGAINASVPNYPDWPIGMKFRVRQGGTGIVTFVPLSGVTLRSVNGLRTKGQYAMVELEKIGTAEWQLTGDLQV